jgi:hypothetical protein
MSAGILVAVALVSAGLASLTARRGLGPALAAVGLGVCVVIAVAVAPLTTIVMGGATFALGQPGADVVAGSAASMLLLLGVAVAVRSTGPRVPAALAVVVAALAAGLAALNGSLMAPPSGTSAQFQTAGADGPPIAIALVTAAAVVLAPILAAGTDGAPETAGARMASRALRVAAVAGGLGLVGMAWLLGPSGPVAADPTGVATALLLVAGSVGLFLGAMPLHTIVARAAVSGPIALVAARGIWLPAAFALAAVAWEQRVLAPAIAFGGVTGTPLLGEVRALIAVVALVTVVGGAIVATLHGDLRHVLAYMLIGDAGLALLALATADPAGPAAATTWLPANAVARTAFAAWTLALAGAWGTARLDELDGWARRAPLLAIGLLGVAAATFGLPGWGIFTLRSSLTQATGGFLGSLMLAAAWLGLAPFIRLAWVGLRRPVEPDGQEPATGPGRLHPVRAGWAGRIDRLGGVQPSAGDAARPRPDGARGGGALGRAGDAAAAAWLANGAVIAACFVLLAAVLAVVVSVRAGGVLASVD